MVETPLKDGLQAMDIAQYLRNHPQFLKDFPDLAVSLIVPREQGQTASLASYQLHALRGKNHMLEHRLTELIAIAGDNEQLMVRVHALTLGLLQAKSLSECIGSVVASLTEGFDTDLVRLVLLHERGELPVADWLQIEVDGVEALPDFAEFLAHEEPMVGRLATDKLTYLFGAQAEQVQSAALMQLGKHGMLAIGSYDANRFHPGMGVVFLRLIAESVTSAIQRFVVAD